MHTIYKATRHTRIADCDEIQAAAVTALIKSYMLYPSNFNCLEIDLTDENVERAICYDCQAGYPDRRVCEFGGAAAWNIYRAIASVWPEINYHTSGRPAVIL